MRQTIRSLVFAGMLCSAAGAAGAEPVVAGHLLTEARAGAGSLFLAHVFNADQKPLKAGSYEIGLELSGGQGRKVYTLKPTTDIEAGSVNTFRMPLTSSTNSTTSGNFRVFVRAGKQTTFSESYTLTNHRLGGAVYGKHTALYTEAPPESGDPSKPPAEVPFENELVKINTGTTPASKPTTGTKTVTSKPTAGTPTAGKVPVVKAGTSGLGAASPVTSTAIPPKMPKTVSQKQTVPEASSKPVVKTPAPTKKEPAGTTVAAETPVKPRRIDPSEFKTIRTIDEELIIYVIRTGDTLKSIAERYYGSAAKERAIAEFNFIDDPKSIKVGEEIIVEVKPLKQNAPRETPVTPVDESAVKHSTTVKPEATAATVTSPKACTGSGATYVIQPGDSLGKIARQTLGKATLAQKLLEANPGLNPKNLKVGTTILIPEISGKQG